ncbi:MAG: hypothetical protein JWR61_1354 [Ferruginibacter sp.]|nr:hypothetical protein [Ferruginibacter sp.]
MWSTEVKSAFAKGCRGSSRASALARNVAYYRAMSVINPTQRPQPGCKSSLSYVAGKKDTYCSIHKIGSGFFVHTFFCKFINQNIREF